MHYMHKIDVDVVFRQMTSKNVIKRHGERAVSAMYKEYIQLDYMKVMKSLDPYRLKISQKRG